MVQILLGATSIDLSKCGVGEKQNLELARAFVLELKDQYVMNIDVQKSVVTRYKKKL